MFLIVWFFSLICVVVTIANMCKKEMEWREEYVVVEKRPTGEEP